MGSEPGTVVTGFLFRAIRVFSGYFYPRNLTTNHTKNTKRYLSTYSIHDSRFTIYDLRKIMATTSTTIDELSEISAKPSTWRSFLPAILTIVGALLMLFARLQIGGGFIGDAWLMMLSLSCYLLAAVFGLTNLYAPSDMARKWSFGLAVLGVFFNLSSW